MIADDVQLIQRILSGDDTAFTALIFKFLGVSINRTATSPAHYNMEHPENGYTTMSAPKYLSQHVSVRLAFMRVARLNIDSIQGF